MRMRPLPIAALVAALLFAAPLDANPLVAAPHAGTPAAMAARCARVGNDDRVVGYDPGFRRAFAAAFPDTPAVAFRTGTIRCMDRRLFACLIGANQPCFEMDARRANAGADAFCRENPGAAVVPLSASGHGSVYDYACRGGRARITGRPYTLDARGFARGLWKPLN